MKRYVLIACISALTSCTGVQEHEARLSAFRRPVVVQPKTTASIELFDAHSITDTWPDFVGKSHFTDTLEIPIRTLVDTSYQRDYVEDYYSDTLSTDGFEVVADYAVNVSHIDYDFKSGNYYYPVYVVNQTASAKTFHGKDTYVFAIQEALDSSERWRPIEGRGFDFCGNGRWALKVNPGEFVTVLMPKYQGDFKTKIRIRMKVGNSIYVSTPFDGAINRRQFHLDKKGSYYRRLLEDKANTIQHFFYGAEPMEATGEELGANAVWTR